MAWYALLATIVTALRRPFVGPLRPSWSFAFEVTVRALRRYMRRVVRWPAPAMRAAWEEIAAPALRGVRRETIDAGGVPAEWFVAPGVAPDAPVLLHWHGGGYVWGSSNMHAELLSRLTIATRLRVLAPNYRRAPEHPFPAAHDDAVKVYRWLLAQPGVSAQHLVVSGDSAGGNLTLELALRLRDREALPLPRALVLLCPWVDLGLREGSVRSNARADWLDAQHFAPWTAAYYPSGRFAEPEASPLYADLRGLPPTLVQVGDAEVLYDQVVELGEALRRAAVPHRLSVYPDMVHDWHVLSAVTPEAARAIAEIARFTRNPQLSD